MNATSAPPGVDYSVHSQRNKQAHEGMQYHGLGSMSVNYKITDVSSTDPAYSASAINTDHLFGANFGRGWVSRKFCDFPQVITIRFEYPVRLKTLQFLCHETMISSRVELYFMPTEAISTSEQRRIGHFEFQNNLSSGPDSNSLQPVRELKTVHFGVTTKQITLHFYGPYQHKDNIFHQVGLISLRTIGEIIGGPPAQDDQQRPAPQQTASAIQTFSQTPIRDLMQKRSEQQQVVAQKFPPNFRNILQQVRQNQTNIRQEAAGITGEAASAAEAGVDETVLTAAEKAKMQLERFKLCEDVIMKQGNRILHLMTLKQEAIENEDYMAAKKIKDLISKIEKQISSIDGQTGEMPDEINPKVLILRHQRRIIDQTQKVMHQPQSAEQVFDQNSNALDMSAQNLISHLSRLQQDRKIVDESNLNNSFGNAGNNGGRNSNMSQAAASEIQQQDQDYEQPRQKTTQRPQDVEEARKTFAQSKHNEDAVVPAHRMGVKMTFEEQMALYDQQIKQGLDPSPNMNLSEEMKDAQFQFGGNDYSGPLNNLFNVDLVKLLTSLKWQDRFQGLKDVTSVLSQYAGEPKFRETINHLLDQCYDEKNTQICLQTILLINMILTSLPEFAFGNMDRAISFISDKGVESKVQLASNTSYELFCRHKPALLHDTIGILATQHSFYNKATLNSHKQILFRLGLIHRATIDFDSICNERDLDTSRPEYPLYEVQEMLKHSLQHPDREIRTISQLILQLLYDKNGFTVVEQIAMQLHPQILTVLKPKIPEVEKVIIFLQKSKRVNNSQIYGSSGANGWPITLKNRMNKGSQGGNTPQQSYVKRKLPLKHNIISSTAINKASILTEDVDAQSTKAGNILDGTSSGPSDAIHQVPNNDLANLLGESQADDASTTVDDNNSSKDTCQFCGTSHPEFINADKMDLHYVLHCQMLTNCAGCTQIIEVSSYTDHKLTQCAKKADFSQCNRCQMAIEADFYEQHVTRQECTPDDTQMVRCPLCQRDLPVTESEEKTWKEHLAIEQCPGANVRISTNAKARVSILRAKQPPASEVIMEEDELDSEGDGDTVGAKTPALRQNDQNGRNTEMTSKSKDVTVNEENDEEQIDEMPEFTEDNI